MDISKLIPSKEEIEQVMDKKVKEIPSIPFIAVKLLKIAQDEETSIEDISKIMETDPGLTIKILKIVNSAAFGLHQKISSVKQAVSLLGLSTVRSLSLSASVFGNFLDKNKKLNFDKNFFWRHCLATAALSKALAIETGYLNPEEAYAAGLLHDISKIILDVYGRIRYGDFLINITRSNEIVVEEERNFIGLGHDDIGAYFCYQWNLPDNLILAIKYHHQDFSHLDLSDNESLLISIVSIANFIATTQGLSSTNILTNCSLQQKINGIIDIKNLKLGNIIMQMDKEVKTTSEYFGFNFPSLEKFRENLLKTNIDLAISNTDKLNTQDKLIHKYKSLDIMSDIFLKPQQNLNSSTIIFDTLKALQNNFHFDRLYFLKINRKLCNFTIIESYDSTKLNTDFSNFNLKINPNNAGGFIECIRKRIPILIKGKTQIEKDSLKNLEIDEMGIIPVSNVEHFIGIIGIDNVCSKQPICINVLKSFTAIANELGRALEHTKSFEKIKAENKLDNLTKLYNLEYFEKKLSKYFKQACLGTKILSLAIIDIDNFKEFNDNFGRIYGDNIIKLIASTIKKSSRPTDFLARLGSDDIIVILNHTNSHDAMRYAKRMNQKVEKLGTAISDRYNGYKLTVSIGVAGYDDSIKSYEELISHAENALRKAKENGTNRVIDFNDMA